MEFFKELWLNQPSKVIGVGVTTLVLFGIYIKLLDIYQQFFLKNGGQVLYPKFGTIQKKLLNKHKIKGLKMKKDIYTNIKESNALESFFECITSCSINSEGVDCTTACYMKHLEPNNIDYPLNFS